MGIAALVAWLLTAGGGFYMLRVWISHGGHRRPSTSKLPPAAFFGHAALAGVGLVVWIAFLFAGGALLAWLAFVLLLPVAGLGFLMLARWVPTYRAHAGATVPAARGASGQVGGEPAERHFPVVVVGAHGLFAVITLLLVVIAAVGAGSA